MSGCQSRTTLGAEPWRIRTCASTRSTSTSGTRNEASSSTLNTLGFHVAFDARVGSGERLAGPLRFLGVPRRRAPALRRRSAGDYTDGITEAFNANDEEFGEGRLVEALQTHRTLAPGDLVAAIYDEVRRFSPEEQRDDMTVIVARCKNC